MFARSLWRAARVIEHLTTGALITLYVSLTSRPGRRPAWLPRAVRWWHARLCRALGVRLQVDGRLVPQCLLVGNHISWLDIPILGALGEIHFLSKSDIRGWPLIGWMAGIAGTRFIARGAHQTDAVLAQLREDLADGRSLMLFPEGTTTAGDGVRRFHPRLFSLAQMPGMRVQPIAIRYRRGEDRRPDTEAPYIGDDTLIANLWRLIRHPDLVAHVQFLPPVQTLAGERRRVIAERARAAILDALDLDVPGREADTPAAGPEPTVQDAVTALRVDPEPA